MSSALIEEPLCLLVGDVGGEVELGDLGVVREEEAPLAAVDNPTNIIIVLFKPKQQVLKANMIYLIV